MRFMVLVKSNKEIEADVLPPREALEAMGEFNEGLAKDGMLLAMDGLRPTSKAKRLHFEGRRATVTDGPFAETKELIAGFWMVQCESPEKVVERFMHAPFADGAVIEIRECREVEDFGDELSDRIRDHRKQLGL